MVLAHPRTEHITWMYNVCVFLSFGVSCCCCCCCCCCLQEELGPAAVADDGEAGMMPEVFPTKKKSKGRRKNQKKKREVPNWPSRLAKKAKELPQDRKPETLSQVTVYLFSSGQNQSHSRMEWWCVFRSCLCHSHRRFSIWYLSDSFDDHWYTRRLSRVSSFFIDYYHQLVD